jgi:hypothetical protein
MEITDRRRQQPTNQLLIIPSTRIFVPETRKSLGEPLVIGWQVGEAAYQPIANRLLSDF